MQAWCTLSAHSCNFLLHSKVSETPTGRSSATQLATKSLETVEKYLRLFFKKIVGCSSDRRSYLRCAIKNIWRCSLLSCRFNRLTSGLVFFKDPKHIFQEIRQKKLLDNFWWLLGKLRSQHPVHYEMCFNS